MIIKSELFGDYCIDIDANRSCYTVKSVEEHIVMRKGKEIPTRSIEGYYTTIEGAILKILNMSMDKGDDVICDLKEYYTNFKTMKNEILNLLK